VAVDGRRHPYRYQQFQEFQKMNDTGFKSIILLPGILLFLGEQLQDLAGIDGRGRFRVGQFGRPDRMGK
jgi:hypothetical protein